MWWHRVSGTVVFATTALYGITALVKMKWAVKDDVHAPMGITVTAVILFLTVSGVVARSRLNRATSGQEKVLKFKMFHKAFGYAMLILS